MHTISDAIGTGPISISSVHGTSLEIRTPIGPRREAKGETSLLDHFVSANDNAEEDNPLAEDKVVKLNRHGYVKVPLGNLGFIINCSKKSNGTNLGACVNVAVLGDPPANWRREGPQAANDNAPDHRNKWPLYRDYRAGLLGASDAENDAAWDMIEYFCETWNSFRGEAESLLPGGFWYSGGGRRPIFCDPGALRGPERFVDFTMRLKALNAKTQGGLHIVKCVVVDRLEMRELADDVLNKAKRAKIGRQRFLAALPPVVKELASFDRADRAA